MNTITYYKYNTNVYYEYYKSNQNKKTETPYPLRIILYYDITI